MPLGFGFAHLAMLGWLAAAAAPWIIHLWSRRKYREVPFAAIEFLLAALRKNARRVRIEQWLLLAVRTAIIALVALAIAEPYLQRSGLPLAAGQRTHKLLVIDGSYSMGYRPADRSRFERARELAAQIVDESGQGDGFSLVLLSEPSRVVVGSPSFDPADFLKEIENLRLPHAGGDLPGCLALVEEVLVRARRDQPRLVREEIYFLTDLGRRSWLPALDGSEAAARFRQQAARLGSEAALVVLDLGQSDCENLAVTSLSASEPFAVIGREWSLAAQIRNFGRQDRAAQTVELYLDGRQIRQARVDCPSGGEAQAVFAVRIDESGMHALEVRLQADALDIDNHRWLSVPVKEAIRVLCVDGRPSGEAFRGASDYLAVALEPRGGAAERPLIRPEVVTESALLELDLADYDLVFLCNVSQFTASEAQLLEQYLRHGGGLVIFLGDQVLAENYNRQLGGADGGPRVLPAELGSLVSGSLYRFDPLDYRHPLLAAFRGQERSGLLTTLVYKYFQLLVPPDSPARVALGFAGTGDPAIVEETIHRGRVALVATSADVSWTAMATWPSYLPLVHELVFWGLQGQLADYNLLVGQSLSAPLRPGLAVAPLAVRPPEGEPQVARVAADESDARWIFADTRQSGIYSVQIDAPEPQVELFAVNVDTAESDLEAITLEQLRDQVWPGVPLVHHTDFRNLDEPAAAEITRRSWLHKALLYSALGLLIGEVFLARAMGRRQA